jgi:hypothetical protein
MDGTEDHKAQNTKYHVFTHLWKLDLK